MGSKKKYKLLDAYCGAGGAGMGYHLSGFEVTGIDNRPQPNYPFRFMRRDALDYITKYGHLYDVIHASPPCQAYSCSTGQYRKKGKEYPDLLAPTRAVIEGTKKYGIIENVLPAPIRKDMVLKGYPFGLDVIRARAFEFIGFFLMQPGFPPKNGSTIQGDYVSVYGNARSKKDKIMKPYKGWVKGEITVLQAWHNAMGIKWKMTNKELSESIPPKYTEYIGNELMNVINNVNTRHCLVS